MVGIGRFCFPHCDDDSRYGRLKLLTNRMDMDGGIQGWKDDWKLPDNLDPRYCRVPIPLRQETATGLLGSISGTRIPIPAIQNILRHLPTHFSFREYANAIPGRTA